MTRTPGRGRPAAAGPVAAAPATRPGDAGTVTAETAVLLPVLALLLAMAVWLVFCLVAQLRCVDAAREGARAAARGDTTSHVRAVARSAGPDDAAVEVEHSGRMVSVRVTAVVRPWGGPLGRLTTVHVAATATSPVEPGATGGSRPSGDAS